MLKGAGKDGNTTVFLLTDTQIKQESFLEDVDGLLNAGEVANLFALDEKQEIIEVCVWEWGGGVRGCCVGVVGVVGGCCVCV